MICPRCQKETEAVLFTAKGRCCPACKKEILPSITCPKCGRTSYNAGDIENKWCAACNQFHDYMLGKGNSLLEGLDALHVIQISNRAQELERAAEVNDAGKYRGLLLLPYPGYGKRIFVATDFLFDSAVDALKHMHAMVDACIAWKREKFPTSV